MARNARRKLQEAGYFLSEMERTKGEEAFFFNLSAFFSAARSVTFFLQKEYGDDADFHDWYSKEQEKMSKNPLYRIIKETRNFVLKESYPETRAIQVTYSNSGADIHYGTLYGDIEMVREGMGFPSEGQVKYYLNLHKVSEIDWNSSIARRPICELCEEAIQGLDELLIRCEENLTESNDSDRRD